MGEEPGTQVRRHAWIRAVLAAALVLSAPAASARAHDEPRAHAGAAAAARTENARPIGHLNPGAYSADVVAHGGYAYLSSWRGSTCPALGVRVISLADLRRPTLAATFADARSEPLLARTWTEKTIVRGVRTPAFAGTLAVTSVQNCDEVAFRGFALYDVTDPVQPRQLALVRTEPRGSHEIWLAVRDGRAYVYTAIIHSELLSAPDYDPQRRTATRPGLPDFRIFDVTDPRQPLEVGSWGAWAELGIHPLNGRGRLNANFVHSVITNPAVTRAFLSYWDLGTVILDISDPARPRYLGRTRLQRGEPEGDAHSAWLAKGGRILVETHETRGGIPVVFDISNPVRPRLVADFSLARAGAGSRLPYYGTSVHDPKLLGDRAFFSWYSQGAVVADLTNPRRPRKVAQFVPPPAVDADGRICGRPGARCTFTWGVFPTRNYVLASDMVGGLWVFRVATPGVRR